MIEAAGLKKRFAKVTAVDGVSFVARDGQVTGLLGPNGAGKTTTLRMIYGLMRPDAGHVLIDGIDAVSSPLAARQRIGVLSDARGLYLRLTARENIRYYGELQGLRSTLLETRIDELLRLLDMGDIADRRVNGFSQGERMKTAIARVLVHDPQNILLDEPTNGLDIMTTRALRRTIKTLSANGKAVVFSTHIMQEVAALCDRVIVIAKGVIRAQGSPDELLAATGKSNLEDAFVACVGSEEGLAA
jgi:sodium transport system ATP-binding protein